MSLECSDVHIITRYILLLESLSMITMLPSAMVQSSGFILFIFPLTGILEAELALLPKLYAYLLILGWSCIYRFFKFLKT